MSESTDFSAPTSTATVNAVKTLSSMMKNSTIVDVTVVPQKGDPFTIKTRSPAVGPFSITILSLQTEGAVYLPAMSANMPFQQEIDINALTRTSVLLTGGGKSVTFNKK